MSTTRRLYIKGRRDLPVIVFIHGLGTNHKVWTDAEDVKILLGRYPLTTVLTRPPRVDRHDGLINFGVRPKNPRTVFHDLKDKGFTLLLYSQRRSAAGYRVILKELKELLDEQGLIDSKPVIFVCHSRGGLIARKLLETERINCVGLITIGTPHHGSQMARLAGYLTKLLPIVEPFLKNRLRKESSEIIDRITTILKGKATSELLPGSKFIKSLDNSILKSIKTLSIGGTDPTLLAIYRFNKKMNAYTPVLKLPNILSTLLPEKAVPEEIVEGKGDSLVTAESSIAPYALDHRNYKLNHAKLLFSHAVRRRIVRFIEEIV